MSDITYKGYDLTTLLEKVARAHYERDRAALTARRPDMAAEFVPWEELSAINKANVKNGLLPIVTATLDAIETTEETS